jgi:ABC-type transport system involved in multi-copper enzyme maturation permease subunit
MSKNFTGNNDIINMIVNLSSTISVIGFYFSSMLTTFLTIMLSIGIVSSELENGTILTILTKPIKRSEYILGKYLGTAVLIILYSAVLYTAVIIISTISKISIVETFGAAALAKGFLFFILQPLTILSLALYGSTKFKTLNNGILIIAIYILGTIGGVIEQVGTFNNNVSLSTIGIIASLISPFEVTYKKMISTIFNSLGSFNVLMGFGISGNSTIPSVWMMVYVYVYLVFFIFMSVKGFEKKDIG